MGEHYRLIPESRSRTSRSQTLRSRSRRSRSGTVRSRTTRARYQLPANVSGRAHESAPTGVSRARHRLARARHSLARAGIRVVRPRTSGRLPTALEALIPWAPVLVGIGILIGFIISVVVLPVSGAPRPGFPDLPLPVAPDPDQAPSEEDAGEGPRYMVPDAYEVQYSPTPEPPPPSSPPPPAFDPGLAGKYKLDEVYSDVFIGRVIIFNESDQAAGWTVELAYGRDVGKLNTFWVDGTPQPSLERVDDRYVFTSAVDVAPGTSAALKVHFDRTGFDVTPKTCLVNGEDCAISDPQSGYGPGW
jgi:hypothetical protein